MKPSPCESTSHTVFNMIRNQTNAFFSYPTHFLLLAFLSIATSVQAAEPPKVHISQAAGWVESVTIDPNAPAKNDSHNRGKRYFLADRQVKIGQGTERYYHYALQLLSEEAVADNSRISVTFDPEFQQLIFHNVRLWRNGKAMPQPIEGRVDLLQREKNLEDLMYDGRWTATLLLEGVKKGDILEYSYSINGQNPAYQDHVTQAFYFQWSSPIDRQFYRLLWPKEKPLNLTRISSQQEVRTIEHPTHREHRMELPYQAPLEIDSESPSWYDPWARVVFSSVKTWKEVVAWGVPHYQTAHPQSAAFRHLVDDLKRQHLTKPDQIAAALHYVQNEIRYVGIEIGSGSFIPTPADETVQRLYGDCKGKTLLLLEILRHLGIEAYPVLVNTRYGEALDEDGPRLRAFNHVLVQVVWSGKTYWLDPTITNQGTRLNNLYQPDYGLALVLRPGNDKLVPMTSPDTGHHVHYDETFNLIAGINQTASYHITTTMSGLEAEKFRRRLNSYGKARIAKHYLDFYSKYYPDIESVNALKIQDDEQENRVVINEHYRIKGIWKNNPKKRLNSVYFHSYAINAQTNRPKILRRNSPYQLDYPVHIHQTIRVLLPEEWNIDNEKIHIDSPYLKYNQIVAYDDKNRVLKLDYEFHSVAKHIKPKEIPDYIATLDKIDASTDYQITHRYGNTHSQPPDNNKRHDPQQSDKYSEARKNNKTPESPSEKEDSMGSGMILLLTFLGVI